MEGLQTTDGEAVEIVNPGRHNTDAGPDFIDAKVRIGGVLMAGNVEMHLKASDWLRHGHDNDPAYDSVVLHVVGEADMTVEYPGHQGTRIPQVVLPVPEKVRSNYDALARADREPRCAEVMPSIPQFHVHNWMAALNVERLEERTRLIMERREACEKNWEDTLFVTMARAFGFGINSEAFELWAKNIPLAAVAKHRDDLFQIEAIFFGQAGWLDDPRIATRAEGNEYYTRLQREYRYLRQKFSLTPMDASRWRFLRLRPQNSPFVRMAQLAAIHYGQRVSLSHLLNAKTTDAIMQLLDAELSPYWERHYTFTTSEPSPAPLRHRLTPSSRQVVTTNAFVPILFAYGRYKSDETLCERALDLLETLPAESNAIVRHWAEAGVKCQSAADSQALLQLHRHYCEPHDCLRCRFGHEYISRTPGFMHEEE